LRCNLSSWYVDPAFRAYAPMLAGRRGGIINVGGLKVHSEEIEAVINRHPSVRVSLGQGRQYPVTGSIVVADVVLKGKGLLSTNRRSGLR
jgi:acyl-coenzyme A synthetase/AMP-(fatty) acid ligase